MRENSIYTAKVKIIESNDNVPAVIDGRINQDKLYKIILYHEVNGGTHEHDFDVHEQIINEMTVTRRILGLIHPLIDIELMVNDPEYDLYVESFEDKHGNRVHRNGSE